MCPEAGEADSREWVVEDSWNFPRALTVNTGEEEPPRNPRQGLLLALIWCHFGKSSLTTCVCVYCFFFWVQTDL